MRRDNVVSSPGQSSRHDEYDKQDIVSLDEHNSLLSQYIRQLRPGMSLLAVKAPVFILEPRSTLERISDFLSHPKTILSINDHSNPCDRFIAVLRLYLSSWHVKPSTVKKPFNPILGETFRGTWSYPDGTSGGYYAEQVSHHPPESAYCFLVPEHGIRIDGVFKPWARFYGNSVCSFSNGIAVLRLARAAER